MKKLLLILLCVPLMFSCGEKKTECDGYLHSDQEFLLFYPGYLSKKQCFEANGKDGTDICNSIYEVAKIDMESEKYILINTIMKKQQVEDYKAAEKILQEYLLDRNNKYNVTTYFDEETGVLKNKLYKKAL